MNVAAWRSDQLPMVKDAPKASLKKRIESPSSRKTCNTGVVKAIRHSGQGLASAATSAAMAEKPRSTSKTFINDLFASVKRTPKECVDETTGATHHAEDGRAIKRASQDKAAAAKKVCLAKQ